MGERGNTKGRALRLLACTSAMLIWGASFVGTRVAYESLTPLWLAFLRFAVAGVALMPYLWARRDSLPRARSLLLCCASGIVGITLYYAAENYGVSLTSASVASIVTASFPLLSVLVEAAVRRRAPGIRQLAGATISLVGVAILAVGEMGAGESSVAGILVLIGAGLLWGIYNLTVEEAGGGADVMQVTGLQFLAGTMGLVPLLALEPVPSVADVLASAPALAFLALGCSLAAYLLYNWSLEGLGPATCAAMVNLVPVFGMVLSTVALQEPLGPHKVAAGLVTLVGIWVGTT